MSNPILFKKVDPTKLLTDKFGKPTLCQIKNDPKKDLAWKTPYGVSFVELDMKSIGLWGFLYDEDLFMRTESGFGVCSGADIEQALKILEKDPDALKKMPKGMETLKEKGAEVARHYSHLGQWQARNDRFSAINNPLGVALGYTFTADTYELMIFETDKVYEHLSLESVLTKIENLLVPVENKK